MQLSMLRLLSAVLSKRKAECLSGALTASMVSAGSINRNLSLVGAKCLNLRMVKSIPGGLGLSLLAMLSLSTTALQANEAPGGLHTKDWFVNTFRDIEEDIVEADAEGKRLVLLFEQFGCSYCTELHATHLENKYVTDFLKDKYMVVQYNLFGAEEVTDLDGEVLTEKTAAEKWGILYTPTFVFLPDAAELAQLREDAAGNTDVGVRQAAIGTLPGLPGKRTFKHMFMWVDGKGYTQDEHFQKFHARMLEQGL